MLTSQRPRLCRVLSSLARAQYTASGARRSNSTPTPSPSLLLAALRAEGDLVVGDNEPYAVEDATDYAIPVYGEGRGLIHTGIEIRQDLISDASGELAWAERLARIFKGIEERLRI